MRQTTLRRVAEWQKSTSTEPWSGINIQKKRRRTYIEPSECGTRPVGRAERRLFSQHAPVTALADGWHMHCHTTRSQCPPRRRTMGSRSHWHTQRSQHEVPVQPGQKGRRGAAAAVFSFSHRFPCGRSWNARNNEWGGTPSVATSAIPNEKETWGNFPRHGEFPLGPSFHMHALDFFRRQTNREGLVRSVNAPLF